MLYKRELVTTLNNSAKSILLLGPRQTGKTTLLKSLKPDIQINLANQSTFLECSQNANFLIERVLSFRDQNPDRIKTIFIDEIQRIPSMLNTIQVLIDDNPGKYRFLLSGSSARKLKRGGANLLPGRIHSYYLGPICSREVDYNIDTSRALRFGTLPGILNETETEAAKTLETYAAVYVKEEIQEENLTRDIQAFSRFIKVIASWEGRPIDFSKIAASAYINRHTAARYFELLEDTLLIKRINSYSTNLLGKTIKHPRFFFFDTGVLNGMLKNFVASDDRKGALFESLILTQILASSYALDESLDISWVKTDSGFEVDFIVSFKNKEWAVEVKATDRVTSKDVRWLKKISSKTSSIKPILLYLGAEERMIDGILVAPWQRGLREIGF